MKKVFAFIVTICFYMQSFACTGFLISANGNHFFGRNYDWVTGTGMVMINAAGLNKTSAAVQDGGQVSWSSQFGSISFNQYGKEFPTGGMNEKGLVVELMWLDGTEYPAPDSRPALNVLQWIQYQLDCSETVDDVIATDKDIRISRTGPPIHYLIADASGRSATVEFLNGKMTVHKDHELPFAVLTNTRYDLSLKLAKDFSTGGPGSVERFATACMMLAEWKHGNAGSAPVDYAFSILGKVAQGSFTKWSIVYDISGRQIHFFTSSGRLRKTISFSDFSFDCAAPAKAFFMADEAGGNIAPLFRPLSYEANKRLIEKSAEESKDYVRISKARIQQTAETFRNSKCNTGKN